MNKILLILFISFSFSQTTLRNGLVAYWKLEETSGTTVYTEVGTINGGNIDCTIDQTGHIGQCYDFSGATQYILIYDRDSLSFTDGSGNDKPFSISMWIYPDVENNFLFTKVNENNYEYYLDLDSPNARFVLRSLAGTNYIQAIIASTFNINNWWLINATYDGSESENGLKIYCNGVVLGTTNTETGTYVGMSNGTSNVTIGTHPRYPETLEFNGRIDEVMLHRRELTALEIKQMYNLGDGIYYH